MYALYVIGLGCLAGFLAYVLFMLGKEINDNGFGNYYNFQKMFIVTIGGCVSACILGLAYVAVFVV